MDYAMIGTIARLTNTRPNWDREVTRAVGAARLCAIAALIRALGAEVEYADLRGIGLSQARPELPDRPLRAPNAIVRDCGLRRADNRAPETQWLRGSAT